MTQFLAQNKLALIVALACVPLVLRMIGPNGLYGFRFGRALEDTEQWYEVNRIGALCLIGVLMAGIAVKQILLSQGIFALEIPKYGSLIDTAVLFIGISAALVLTRK